MRLQQMGCTIPSSVSTKANLAATKIEFAGRGDVACKKRKMALRSANKLLTKALKAVSMTGSLDPSCRSTISVTLQGVRAEVRDLLSLLRRCG
jgi:hypothetical protein